MLNNTNNLTNLPLKYILYARKSSDSEDKQILSLPAQIRELSEYANKNKIHIIKTITESKSAYKTNNRVQFDLMIKDLQKEKANAILTWKLDRLSRNPAEGGLLIQMLQDGNIKEIRTATGDVYTSESDHLVLQLHLGIANQYSRILSQNVKMGNREKFLKKGQWSGLAKQGYSNFQEPITKEHIIIVDELRFPLLQKAGKLIINGSYTPMQALKKLNNDWGYRTHKTKKMGGRPMSVSSFYKFLADPYYYGLMVRLEGTKMGKHKKMFTKEEFDQLQMILGRKGKPQVTKHEFAFKEVLRCGECNGAITCEEKWQIICPVCKTKFHKGKTTNKCSSCNTLIEKMQKPTILHYVYYHCTKRVNKNCSQGYISLKELEKQVDQELKRFEIPKKFMTWGIKYLNELNNNETTEREVFRTNLKLAYDDCVKKLDNLLKLKISVQNANNTVISEDEYITQRKYLLQEKEDLLERINSVDERMNNWHELTEKTFNFVTYARYWFAKGDLKTKTQILGALGSNLTLYNQKLLVDGQKHFFIIENGKKELDLLTSKLEPDKNLDVQSETDLSKVIYTHWLADRDSNPKY